MDIDICSIANVDINAICKTEIQLMDRSHAVISPLLIYVTLIAYTDVHTADA